MFKISGIDSTIILSKVISSRSIQESFKIISITLGLIGVRTKVSFANRILEFRIKGSQNIFGSFVRQSRSSKVFKLLHIIKPCDDTSVKSVSSNLTETIE
jgi:hypothetical protein